MTDKTVAELMALALRVKDTGGAYDYGDGDEAPYREARDALEQAIRRAVDWGEPVAWLTKESADGKQKLTKGEATTNQIYTKTHSAWKWVPLYARSKS